MPDYSWIFREMSHGEQNSDPLEGEFFTGRDSVDRLVRETKQNSLDESLNGQRVKVRIAIHRDDPLDMSRARAYFGGLIPHMEVTPGINDDLVGLLRDSDSVPFMTIEDFGTNGLIGDVNQFNDWQGQSAEGNNFYWFFRNIGRTGKGGTDGGSWGVGKWVIPDTSKINSFFAYSVRAASNDVVLMGQSILKKHTIEDGEGAHRYAPYGFFAVDQDGLQLPIFDANFQRQFREDFQLSRSNETGLSLVIPFPEDEIIGVDILRSVLRYYFWPILSGDLEVEIEDADDSWLVDLNSATSLVDDVEWPAGGPSASDVKKNFELAQGLKTTPEEEFVSAAQQPSGTPHWDGRFSEELLDDLRDRYQTGETLPFRIPVRVYKNGLEPADSYFDIILQKDLSISSLRDTYVRGYLTIPDLSRASTQPVRALLHAGHKPLQEMLRDSEEPSHSTWKEGALKVNSAHYRYGKSTVLFVKRSVTEIIRILSRVPDARYNDLLNEFFSIDRVNPRVPRGPGTPPPPPIPPPQPRLFSVTKLAAQGGFRVKADRPLPSSQHYIKLETAYHIRRGNPLKKYRSHDFDLAASPINISPDSADVFDCHDNTISFRPESVGGSITVTGFDKNRDIYIKSTLVRPTEDAC